MRIVSASFLVLFALGCTSNEPLPPSPKPTKKSANIIKVETPVPAGRHVTCEELVPDLAPYTAGIGDDIGSVKDMTKTNSRSTAMCALHRAGEPPKQDLNPTKLADKYAKHGVLPGDEYCTVTAYCSLFMEHDAFVAKCEKDGNQMGELAGHSACVRKTERGPEYAYTYKFIDPDTKCLIEAMGGPSVTSEPIVQGCAKAAMDSIAKANIANHK